MIGWFLWAVVGTFYYNYFLSGQLLSNSPVTAFLDYGQFCFQNFYSIVPDFFCLTKCHMNHPLNPLCVIGIAITEIYFPLR